MSRKGAHLGLLSARLGGDGAVAAAGDGACGCAEGLGEEDVAWWGESNTNEMSVSAN